MRVSFGQPQQVGSQEIDHSRIFGFEYERRHAGLEMV
jgi:hypothetical protein